jgi:hypothetical protein
MRAEDIINKLPTFDFPTQRPPRLIDDLIEMVAEQFHPVQAVQSARYTAYKSHYEFCTKEFGEIYTDDIRQVMDSVDENEVTIAKSGNQTGKTHGAARIIMSFLSRFDDAQVWCAAAPPERNLRSLLFAQVDFLWQKYQTTVFSGFQHRLGSLKIADPQNALHYAEGVSIPQSADSQARKASFSGKHAPHILFVLDEADGIPSDIFNAIESCMSGAYVRLLLMFNPREEKGPVVQMERSGHGHVVTLSALTHTNVMTGEPIIPGAVDRPTVVRRINQWSIPLQSGEKPDGECFEVPDYLVGAVAYDRSSPPKPFPPLPRGWRRTTEGLLDTMVLARYPSQSSQQLIARTWIENAQQRWLMWQAQFGARPPHNILPIHGLDVSDMGADYNALCSRYGGWVAPIRTWRGVDPGITAKRATEFSYNEQAQYTNVDSTGVGAGVAPEMVRGGVEAYRIMMNSKPDPKLVPESVMEVGNFKSLRDLGWWLLREWLRTDPSASLPPDEDLAEELLVPSYELKGKDLIVSSKDVWLEKIKRSPDRATSLMMTFVPVMEDGGEIDQDNYIDSEFHGTYFEPIKAGWVEGENY